MIDPTRMTDQISNNALAIVCLFRTDNRQAHARQPRRRAACDEQKRYRLSADELTEYQHADHEVPKFAERLSQHVSPPASQSYHRRFVLQETSCEARARPRPGEIR